MEIKKGWKPIPLSLKIISIISTLWYLMAVISIGVIAKQGFPFLGVFTFGLPAMIIVILFYFLAPATFIYGLWNRHSWTAKFALSYIGFFLLNSIIAYISLPEHFASSSMYFADLIANIIFFVVIYKTRSYFKQ